ncbi:alpha/beta hydrolase [Clostridium sp. WILCCON 0269]|uniref:Alpha/beta hydrolase n=1 Tax=Candidatus Clostridium eludens TaxID=3381663 RepID=A0ABW8SVS2_9CLOT
MPSFFQNVLDIGSISKKLYSFDEMVQNGKDAISYAVRRFNDKIFIMGSSQGGILTIALAGLDSRIKAAFPHNILIPALPDSICVTRFPNNFKHIYKLLVMAMKLAGKLVPRLQLHVSFYLDVNKVTENKEIYKKLDNDPIGFMKYPVYFLTSLFCADLKQVYDGSIKCPVVVIAAKKDPLFPLDYTKKIFELINAPHKEMLIFDEDKHLIMNECVDKIIDKIVCKVKEFV